MSFAHVPQVKLFSILMSLPMAGMTLTLGASTALAQLVSNPNGNFFDRLYAAYAEEWNKIPVDDPNAPPSRRPLPFPPAPVTAPPQPFIEWPFGGVSPIGASIPNAVDSPLMKALAPTDLGKAMEAAHIQLYGWINAGGNLSTAKNRDGGNLPSAYSYKPNRFQLDQAVLYLERIPDTVQKDHIDWGFRLSAIYGENYRYTTADGYASGQLLYQNAFQGYDFPMVYGELYIPWIMEGAVIRAGRYVSPPDIEAQLSPNNYMYSHSMTYAYDNYTSTGLLLTVNLNKNWIYQTGLTVGTDTAAWNQNKDPGYQPTFTNCLRWTSDSANDNLYGCANGINDGHWGYNNLQWYGITYFHKFDEKWHISFESYYEYQRDVPNKNNAEWANYPNVNVAEVLSFRGMINPPNLAQCSSVKQYCKTAGALGLLAYLNYQFTPLDNLSWRAELYNDQQGQRTGYKTTYLNYAVGWQHWFGPQVEIRPEIAYYHSTDVKAFDLGTKQDLTIVSSDIIWHF